MQATIARPLKIAGRVVLGPRLVGEQYARIIALANGAGRIEIYDGVAEAWCPAPDTCSFTMLWSAAPAPLTFTARASGHVAETGTNPGNRVSLRQSLGT
jgi:hypothetical protein